MTNRQKVVSAVSPDDPPMTWKEIATRVLGRIPHPYVMSVRQAIYDAVLTGELIRVEKNQYKRAR